MESEERGKIDRVLQVTSPFVLTGETTFSEIRDYTRRVSLFVGAIERMQEYVLDRNVQIPEELTNLRLVRTAFRVNSGLQFPEIEDLLDDTGFDMEEIMKRHPDVDVESRYTYAFIEGYAEFANKNKSANIARFGERLLGAIKEVIFFDFPDSLLAKDLTQEDRAIYDKKNNNSRVSSLSPQGGESLRQQLDQQMVSFEEAFAEGQPELTEVLEYNNNIELSTLLDRLGITGELFTKILTYDQNKAWDAKNLISFAISGVPVQQEFARAFLEKGKDAYEQLAEAERIKGSNVDMVAKVFEVLNVDSQNKRFFWMFAPYIYDELKGNAEVPGTESNDMDVIKRILLWAGNTRTGTRVLIEDIITLPGLGLLNGYTQIKEFRVSADPNGASHRFVRQEARKVVNEVLLVQDRFDLDRAFLQ